VNGKPIKPGFLIEVMALELFVPPFSGGYSYASISISLLKDSRSQFELVNRVALHLQNTTVRIEESVLIEERWI
jgi:hypothetical protein